MKETFFRYLSRLPIFSLIIFTILIDETRKDQTNLTIILTIALPIFALEFSYKVHQLLNNLDLKYGSAQRVVLALLTLLGFSHFAIATYFPNSPLTNNHVAFVSVLVLLVFLVLVPLFFLRKK